MFYTNSHCFVSIGRSTDDILWSYYMTSLINHFNCLFCRFIIIQRILPTNKEKYKAFIKDNYVPIFYQDWYLDAVCDRTWDVTLHEEEGEMVGVLVFMIKKKFGLSYILHPLLCPYMGPLFFGFLDVNEVYQSLIDQLPPHQLMIQDYFHTMPQVDSPQRISRKKYTYIIDGDTDIEAFRASLSSQRRRKIRLASEALTYEEETEFSVFEHFMNSMFAAQGKANPHEGSMFERLDRELVVHNARKIVKCTNAKGDIVAMCYLLIDEKWVYNLANNTTMEYRHEGMSLIMMNEIASALRLRRSFDFEGSVIPGVEEFFKSFKGTKTTYQSAYYSKNRAIDFLVKLKNPNITRP